MVEGVIGILKAHLGALGSGELKKRTAACRPHAGRTLIADVIVMLKLRHHAVSQHIQDFLAVFFMFFFQYKMR